MKMRPLVSMLILVVAVLIITGSYAYGQNELNVPIEPLFGTWVNPDYEIIDDPNAKVVIKPDGILEQFGHVDITVGVKGTYTIIDSWMDSAGNKYYKAEKKIHGLGGGKFKDLWKLNENETELELIWEVFDYPPEIDRIHVRYRIYHRQE
jgi:hypothetical protein